MLSSLNSSTRGLQSSGMTMECTGDSTVRVRNKVPEAKSQSRTVPSIPAVQQWQMVGTGTTTTLRTKFLWPFKTVKTSPVCTLNTVTVSDVHTSNLFPSLENIGPLCTRLTPPRLTILSPYLSPLLLFDRSCRHPSCDPSEIRSPCDRTLPFAGKSAALRV